MQTRRRRSEKKLSSISMVLLVVGALLLIALAWPHPRAVPRTHVTAPEPAVVPSDPVSEPPLSVAKIALPEPPRSAIAELLPPRSVPVPVRSPTSFSAAPVRPALKARKDREAATEAVDAPEDAFVSLKHELEKANAVPEILSEPAIKPTPRRHESGATISPLRPAPASESAIVNTTPASNREVDPIERDQAVVTNVAATIAEGRALLRILEHAKGPSIEIAWPSSTRSRRRLFEVLSRCYGLQLGIIAADEAAYVIEPRTGKIAPLDLDRTSGFVRVVRGASVPNEAAAFSHLRRGLADLSNATPVRTFPRRFDALLLGGLQIAAAKPYANIRSIRASYEHDGNRVRVTRISVDGSDQPGSIDLTPAARCA